MELKLNWISALPVPPALPADNCNQEALLAAVQAPVHNNSTLPLPAPLPTIAEEEAREL